MDVTVSVVIPVRLAQATIESTLEAAIAQAREVGGEVIVAVWRGDPCFQIVELIAGRQPGVLRLVAAEQPCGIPHLRRDGVRAARAPWVVITEDHCLFPSGWLAEMVKGAGDVRGGGVTNGRPSYAGWAQYFARYAAFMPPVLHGPVQHLSGCSACYPRRLLESASIDDGFWEAEVNRELLGQGVGLLMCPSLTLEQRQQRGWLEFMPLRFRHGRCYGARRGGSRLGSLLRAPLIPLILMWRNLRAQSHKHYQLGWFTLTLPLLVCYILAWSLGEVHGSLCGPGGSCRNTD